MTYVEFFDELASENITACLIYAPERVIYIGTQSKVMKKHIADYTKVFAERGQSIEFLYKTVTKSNLQSAVSLLQEIVDTYEDCVFDVTGGEEILSLALGIVYERNPGKNIRIHKFNLRNNAVYDCDKDGNTVYRETPTLSVREQIRIYGGDVVYGSVGENNTYLWDLTPGFRDDCEQMWSVCKEDVRQWNTQIGVFAAAEAVGNVSEDGLTTVAPLASIAYHLSRHKATYKHIRAVIAPLLRYGLLTACRDDGMMLTVSYKNEQVKKCLTKAGQALEMKVFLTAKGLTDSNGEPLYDDAVNGVVIDWDGTLHDEETQALRDTENEIDILLMHDIVPVFVSCKNGFVTADELYKLHTVAERFGGKYSKKILVATSVDALKDGAGYFRQRARDMNITLIEDVQNMSDAELAKKLKNLWL